MFDCERIDLTCDHKNQNFPLISLQKKRKKPSKYVDHDNVNEYPGQENVGWKGYNSPPGPYDSPRGESESL